MVSVVILGEKVFCRSGKKEPRNDHRAGKSNSHTDAFLCEPANWMQNAQYDSLTVFQLTATKTKIWPIKHRNSRSAATYNQKLSSQSHLHTWSWVRRRTTGLPSLNQMKKSLIYSNLLCHWEAHGSSCKCHKMCLDKTWEITHLHTNMPSAKATKASEELL